MCCIRGAYWDVVRNDVTGMWGVRTPDGRESGKWTTRNYAREAAETIMRKWGVV